MKKREVIDKFSDKLKICNTIKLLKIITFCILFVFSTMIVSFNVIASEEKFFEDYIESSSSMKIGQTNYYFVVSSTTLTVKGIKTVKIPLLECDTIENIQFCYLLNSDSKAKVKISYITPDISIERSIEDSILLIGKKTEMTITIRNEGDYIAENFSYEETLPDYLDIVEISNCKYNNKTIYLYREELETDDSIECTIEIMPRGLFDVSSTAKYNYFDGNKITEKYTSKLNLKSDTGISRTVITPSELDIGDSFSYEVEYENDNTNDFDIAIMLTLPEGINILSEQSDSFKINYPYQNIEQNKTKIITKNITLTESSSKTFTVLLSVSKPGNLEIIEQNSFLTKSNDVSSRKDNQITVVQSSQKRYTVLREDLIIEDNFESDEEIGESEQLIKLEFSLYNKNKDLKFKNININFTNSLFFIEDNYLDEISPLTRKVILNRVFTLPNITEQRKYSLKLDITYETEFGEKLKETLTRYILVKPKGNLIITHDIDNKKDGLTIFSENLVVTKIKNTKNENLDLVCITEEFDKMILIKGINEVCFSILKNEEKEIMRYYLKPEEIGKGSINTKLEIKQKSNLKNSSSAGILSIEEFEDLITIKNPSVENSELDVIFTLPSETIYKGNIVSIPLTITNNNDFVVENLIINFPILKNIDYITKESIIIPKINPSETIKISDAVKIRVKEKGNIIIPENKIYFTSEKENINTIFMTETNKLSMQVIDNYFDEAAIILERNIISKEEENITKYYVDYEIKNIGTNPSNLFLDDKNFNLYELIEIDSDSKENLKISLDKYDLVNIKEKLNGTRAHIIYNVKGFEMTTYSEPLSTHSIKIEELNTNNIIKDINNKTNNSNNEINKINYNQTNNKTKINLTDESNYINGTEIINDEKLNKKEIDNETDIKIKKNFILVIIEKIKAIFNFK